MGQWPGESVRRWNRHNRRRVVTISQGVWYSAVDLCWGAPDRAAAHSNHNQTGRPRKLFYIAQCFSHFIFLHSWSALQFCRRWSCRAKMWTRLFFSRNSIPCLRLVISSYTVIHSLATTVLFLTASHPATPNGPHCTTKWCQHTRWMTQEWLGSNKMNNLANWTKWRQPCS